MPGDPFRVDLLPRMPLGRVALTATRPLLEWLLRMGTYRRLYAAALSRRHCSFAQAALDALSIGVQYPDDALAGIPATGPLIVAANHPHGALDGLALVAVAARVRPDVKLLANHLLARIPEMRDMCFFVDPFDGARASARSLAGLRAAHLWLRGGGTLIVFPSGEVAHQHRGGRPIDAPWKTTVGRLALASSAHVVPAFIEGRNSALFYAAGRVHPALRTALLPRELLRQRGRGVAIRFGQTIGPQVLATSAGDAAAATCEIRRAVEQAHSRVGPGTAAPHVADGAIAAEIERLPGDARLVESGAFHVYCVRAQRIPSTLREIGRLREVTYRGVGEGTGRELDLDRFDEHYLHLFVWNAEKREVVGAYRLGATDSIVAAKGVEGLYTRTLFRYDGRFIDAASPALELGRSFVRAEYQRNHSALLLLWKGICRFVSLNPRYRRLFGAVSISARYADTTRELLMRFLEQNHLDAALAPLVAPVAGRPGAPSGVPAKAPAAHDDVNRLVASWEADGKGMPVLLRQYLKLNARLIACNVDRDFGDALDALMIVDLATVQPVILQRYFGPAAADAFLARHRPVRSPQAA